jgi:predicted HTH transcriptional regulator
MNTSSLEQLLEARGESPSLDYKGPVGWSTDIFAKDLLAMANTPGGGRIVVGVEDGTFERVGVTSKQRDTYNLDIMRDQMTRFADPHVLFDVEAVNDAGGLEFVVITVQPFQEVPVICRISHQGAGTQAATIYFRGSHRRPESAPISNAYDMRAVTTLAASRLKKHLEELGFVIAAEDEKRFDDELAGI